MEAISKVGDEVTNAQKRLKKASTMTDFRAGASAFLVMGFLMLLFGISGGEVFKGVSSFIVDPIMISGFVCYLVACMIIVFIKYGEDSASKVLLVISCIVSLVSGVLLIVGLVFYRVTVVLNPQPYQTTLVGCSAFFSLVGGLFMILDCRKSRK